MSTLSLNAPNLNAWTLRWSVAVLALSLLVTVGCKRTADDADARQETPEVAAAPTEASGDTPEDAAVENAAADSDGDDTSGADDARRETADAADKMLRQRLMGKVMKTVKEDGLAAAVTVCHEVALPMTEDVGEEMGVNIGRVSDKLRNPKNDGPDWVAPLIDTAGGEATYAVQDETFRAVKPLRIAENCLKCHGAKDTLDPEVVSVLDEHYPDDQATGYEVGDIRGWVWVEVP